MDLPVNHFKRALQDGKLQIGLWSHLCSPISTEILGHCGFDWMVLDMEHSPNELPHILSQLQALKGSPTMPVVRPPWNDMVTFKRLLDVGAQTLIVPYIQNADEARRAVAATRYPPQGLRGYAGAPRASGYGRIKDYAKRCADEICLLLQIETVEGLGHLEEIAAVEGVDGVFIGPSDLAATHGHLGNPGHPDIDRLIFEAGARLAKAGKPAGFLTPNQELARRTIDAGFLFVAVGSDSGLMVKAADTLAKTFKG